MDRFERAAKPEEDDADHDSRSPAPPSQHVTYETYAQAVAVARRAGKTAKVKYVLQQQTSDSSDTDSEDRSDTFCRSFSPTSKKRKMATAHKSVRSKRSLPSRINQKGSPGDVTPKPSPRVGVSQKISPCTKLASNVAFAQKKSLCTSPESGTQRPPRTSTPMTGVNVHRKSPCARTLLSGATDGSFGLAPASSVRSFTKENNGRASLKNRSSVSARKAILSEQNFQVCETHDKSPNISENDPIDELSSDKEFDDASASVFPTNQKVVDQEDFDVVKELKRTNQLIEKMLDQMKKTECRVEAIEEKLNTSSNSSTSSSSGKKIVLKKRRNKEIPNDVKVCCIVTAHFTLQLPVCGLHNLDSLIHLLLILLQRETKRIYHMLCDEDDQFTGWTIGAG